MSPTLLAEPTVRRTVADLLHDLGDVPADRILLDPAPGMATEDDLIALMDGDDKRLCELIDGTLVEKAMGAYESGFSAILIQILGSYVRTNKLGIVFAPDAPFRVKHKRVRMPDVMFVSRDRLKSGGHPKLAILDLAPDLAVEIVSPSNTRGELAGKRTDYFAAGVRLVWEIDPRNRRDAVYTAPDAVEHFDAAGVLSGRDVLPGFELRLAEVFEELVGDGA